MQNGEITDPPASSNKAEATPPRYAIPRTTSPKTESPSAGIFCSTCLKNQYLFTASLAQYFPDDPEHPDYAKLEKNYYTFRRGLEQRYPQICADCEPKVLDRLQQAKYTAQTDHLRRMIDRSRKDRTITRKSPLDFAGIAGQYLWTAGFVLEYFLHACSMCDLLMASMSTQDEPLPGVFYVLRSLRTFLIVLPSIDRLRTWSLTATALSVWWNPRFTQTVRGFTKHLIGLSTWYTYQFMLLVVKMAYFKISGLHESQEARVETHLAAHGFMATFILMVSQASMVVLCGKLMLNDRYML